MCNNYVVNSFYAIFKCIIRIGFGATLILLSTACEGDVQRTDIGYSDRDGSVPVAQAACDTTKPLVRDANGVARVALVVGVSDYDAKTNIRDLKGAKNDAENIRELLTNNNGYDFPEQNVCMLTDTVATAGNFTSQFDKFLVLRVRSDDIVVVYFAGHGSQTLDGDDGDETDGFDETIIFHDGVELVDDIFNQYLAKLYQKTQKITVILDSCNSATATRNNDVYVTRYVTPDTSRPKVASISTEASSTEYTWISEKLDNIIFLAAADDGTSALEVPGRGEGVFTSALIDVFSQVHSTPLTYAQAGRQIDAKIRSSISPQRPSYHGPLERYVFDNTARKRPLAYDIVQVDTAVSLNSSVKISGPFLHGIGPSAELAVYSGAAGTKVVKEPSKAKAMLSVNRIQGVNIEATVVALNTDNGKLAIGDIAVLVRPSDTAVKLKVAFANNLPSSLVTHLKNEQAEDNALANAITFVSEADVSDFELLASSTAEAVLVDTQGFTRNRFCLSVTACDDQNATNVVAVILKTLMNHARQKSLSMLQGEGGKYFTDQSSLAVSIKPLPPRSQDAACANAEFKAERVNNVQRIPLCYANGQRGYSSFWYQVQVKLLDDPPSGKQLFVGGVILWNNGSIDGFSGTNVPLRKGQTEVFRDEFGSTLPLHTIDRILVFGTLTPVNWEYLTSIVAGRSASTEPVSALETLLEDYVWFSRGGTKRANGSPWTLSMLQVQVEPSDDVLRQNNDSAPSSREYTLLNFDIRPYMPDDPESSLYKVLAEAHRLTMATKALHRGAKDGIAYAKHGWSAATDEDNLARGIDCSRAIWYAFTRAGLNYTASEAVSSVVTPGDLNPQYLTTAGMVREQTPLSNNFERCDDKPLQLGDVLVYRDDFKGDGHTVMVIDPKKRVAWGSHGWDGNSLTPGFLSDTGVEYQLLKYKKDWQRWDRSTMHQRACWRHKQFGQENAFTTYKTITRCDPALNCEDF
jgi:hypothetical protein